ncbi:hypothetical protein LPJ66_001826 [Kickxella alabastrina]|uniref:Uncharacterized protein n=1 Tax=Kickxella alabastrina TaxID=61397 RepID=A0ACC1ISF3_9FUNG|nr:hypothetical protein LPJ66_001826 [Kickxella alabastrina]
MSLSRLPQVALRRLMPAITAVPKSLDDDQLKKILDPQHQHAQLRNTLPSKSELSTLSTTQGLLSALSKLSTSTTQPGTSPSSPAAVGRLLMNLIGAHGKLSSQDLALLKSTTGLGTEDGESVVAVKEEPGEGGVLDSASVDALVLLALRDTTASSPSPPISLPSSSSSSSSSALSTVGAGNSGALALEEHNNLVESYEMSSDDDSGLPPIPSDLSSSERRKEQNRRAQKKFRQKDKVRQKEIKWRAAQYEDLVESNKRFKRDIDSISRERDMYRRILENSGVDLTAAKILGDSKSSKVTGLSQAEVLAPVAAQPEMGLDPMLVGHGMDQIAQDTFGSISGVHPQQQQQQQHQRSLGMSMNDMISSLVFGAVKSDPMFGVVSQPNIFQHTSTPSASLSPTMSDATSLLPASLSLLSNSFGTAVTLSDDNITTATTGSATTSNFNLPSAGSSASLVEGQSGVWFDSADMILVDSPIIADHMDTTSGCIQQQQQQMVDPMAFIDELLASPEFSSGSVDTFGTGAVNGPGSMVRKRSFDDMF